MRRTRVQRGSTGRVRQLTFSRRGGARPGAGRKPRGPLALVSHTTRERVSQRVPVLVTVKLEHGLPSLRRGAARDEVLGALRAGKKRLGMRVIHFSLQSNHVHAIVEARDARALSRGMKGLCVRIARALNRVVRRRGRVFADRFHSRALRTPRAVRHALAYTLNNARRHALRVEGIDPCSSGAAFDGWIERGARALASLLDPPVVRAQSWLLRIGWRRHGLVRVSEVPGPRGRDLRASR